MPDDPRSDQELADEIQRVVKEEAELSYRRRALHAKIDILRAELVNRMWRPQPRR